MKKYKNKPLKALITITILLFMASLVGPELILKSVRQPETSKHEYSDVFYSTYDEIRAHLKDRVADLKDKGITVETSEYAIDESDGLYIDNIYLPATETQEDLIVLTTGVHDTEKVGILIVANINPYGMKYMRRYNENNVDLNRNFILDWENFDLTSNKDYPEVKSFLQPEGKIGNALWHEINFYANLAKEALTKGADKVSDALLTGQYEYPQGVYYGGNGDEASTAYLKGVFNDCLESGYENIVHIDIHSGYGPRYNMVIFNSGYETMTEAETKEAFRYDYVISHDSESFYATIGDTTDYFYRLAESKNTDKELFSTCFEFGTIGDSFIDSILSLKYTVDENRQHWYPTENETTKEVIKENYNELFYPTEKEWREKTVEDFIIATEGVLKAKLK